MNRVEANVQACITRLRTFVAKYQAEIDKLPALNNAFIELFGVGDEIEKKTGNQKANIEGVTKEKKELKTLLSEETEIIAGAVYNFGLQKSDTPLITAMEIKSYQVEKLKDEITVPHVMKVYEAAKENIAALGEFGITQLKLDGFKKLIDDFSSKRQLPKSKISEKHSQTTALDSLSSTAKKILSKKIDKLMLQFKKSNAEIYDEYCSAGKIEKTHRKKDDQKPTLSS